MRREGCPDTEAVTVTKVVDPDTFRLRTTAGGVEEWQTSTLNRPCSAACPRARTKSAGWEFDSLAARQNP
jgi:hypothetical protein